MSIDPTTSTNLTKLQKRIDDELLQIMRRVMHRSIDAILQFTPRLDLVKLISKNAKVINPGKVSRKPRVKAKTQEEKEKEKEEEEDEANGEFIGSDSEEETLAKDKKDEADIKAGDAKDEETQEDRDFIAPEDEEEEEEEEGEEEEDE